MARCVQFPYKQGEVALIFQGGRGAGKGTLAQIFGKIFGTNYVHISDADHLVGKFNDQLRNAILVLADEAFYAGNKTHENVLKALITEPKKTTQAKFQDARATLNMLHLMMASNSDWVVPAGLDERRYCVITVSDKRKGNFAYFDRLHAHMANGGLEAMLYDLLNYDLSKFDVRKVPQTKALLEQKLHSMDSVEKWLFDCLVSGQFGGGAWNDKKLTIWEDDGASINKNDAYNSYLNFSHQQHDYKPASRSSWGKSLKKALGKNVTTSRVSRSTYGGSTREYHLIFKGLIVCRKAFEKHAGGKIAWEN